ncbi:uncharacterized protein B0H64DRAFT_439938 [Chaetomium fimeti]|uniref:Uncharacterized protein n=1 Tax=Chaetomium fimeti TaxID=1854472 RepID=A0AAE0HN39_9PEZI|nr:hypothetical protein B0H64DRAFT_439938 [Chaetomium fimeti]
MKAVTTIILTLATLAFAAPNPDANADALSARQGNCVYDCQCQDGDGTPFIPVNEDCCQGDINETGENCNDNIYPFAMGYASCCRAGYGRPVCKASSSDCLPVSA